MPAVHARGPAEHEGTHDVEALLREEQARAIGRPDAVRAIGGANARNPISIVVPCHRVIGADGRELEAHKAEVTRMVRRQLGLPSSRSPT